VPLLLLALGCGPNAVKGWHVDAAVLTLKKAEAHLEEADQKANAALVKQLREKVENEAE